MAKIECVCGNVILTGEESEDIDIPHEVQRTMHRNVQKSAVRKWMYLCYVEEC